MKEVVITNKKDDSFNFARGKIGRNACGDYVCVYNILNCRNHVTDGLNTQPVVGNYYMVNGRSIEYKECKVFARTDISFVQYKGINLPKEFYQSDYKDPNEPALFSTIYWNHATLLKANKESRLSFHTSDITGKFRIVVQGITNKDVIYAEHFFEVK